MQLEIGLLVVTDFFKNKLRIGWVYNLHSLATASDKNRFLLFLLSNKIWKRNSDKLHSGNSQIFKKGRHF